MSKLNANAQPFVPATTRAATTDAATRQLSANAQPFTVASATRAEHHAVKRGRRKTMTTDEERSLFVTFSSGSPLTEQEISQYFTRMFGTCVEYVYVKEEEKRDPEFGKITFRTCIVAENILLNRKVVKIWVNNKPIWLKKYVPRSQRKLMAQKSF